MIFVRVHLRDHIIVCGMPQRLNEFLDPIKFSMLMKDKFPSPRSKSECMDQYGQVVPTLFLWDGPISPDQLKVSHSFLVEIVGERMSQLDSPTSLRTVCKYIISRNPTLIDRLSRINLLHTC